MSDSLNRSDFLSQLEAAIERRMARRQLSVMKVASDMNVQAQQLRRLIKSATGMSALQYFSLYRLERAKHELIEHDMKAIALIGYACGFEEPTHFTRFFKSHMGMTPKEFRHQHADDTVAASEQ